MATTIPPDIETLKERQLQEEKVRLLRRLSGSVDFMEKLLMGLCAIAAIGLFVIGMLLFSILQRLPAYPGS